MRRLFEPEIARLAAVNRKEEDIKVLKKNQAVYSTLGIFTILGLINIQPYFYQRVNIDYGNDVTKDPFRTTEVAAYRADYKTTYDYLKNNIRKDDVWINVMGNSYYDGTSSQYASYWS